MPESPRRLDLRLTIPAAAPYREVATELAGKFAEYAGAAAPAAGALTASLEALMRDMSAADVPIDLELSAAGRELVITATAGAITRQATCPLPD